MVVLGPHTMEDDALITFIAADQNSDANISRHEAKQFMKNKLQLDPEVIKSILNVMSSKYIERYRFGPYRGKYTKISVNHFTKF